jgi:16S rRNA (guanine527-N7)-methyltransferase
MPADRAESTPAQHTPVEPLPAAPGFVDAAREIGIEFEPADVERLGHFLALMLEANKTTNLTAITDPTEAWRKHILDAIALVPVIETIAGERKEPPAEAGGATSAPSAHTEGVQANLRVIDVGSGGGVPAIPLAIVMPHVQFTLVESTGKKVEFLRHVAKTIRLKNVTIMNARAEAMGQDHKVHRERYDIATARALGHLTIIAELLGPLVKPRGYVVAIKGAKADQELTESARALGLIGLRHAQTMDTPTGRLVLLEKTTRTPKSYPRRDGEPARAPLKNLAEKRRP